MANATSGHTYAQIVNGLVHWVFGATDMPEWNGAQIEVVDITSVSPVPAQGWSYSGGTFTAPPAPSPPTLVQQAAAAINAGLTLTLSGSLTLPATLFPTDPTTTAKIGAVVTTLLATGAFPGGATSYPMKDATGAWHHFTATQYQAVAGAIAAYAGALILIADGNPLGAIELPPASATVVL